MGTVFDMMLGSSNSAASACGKNSNSAVDMGHLDTFQSFLLENKKSPFLVIEPGGNNGDQLIYLGAEKVLKSIGISYRKMSFVNSQSFSSANKLFHMFLARLSALSVLAQKIFPGTSNSVETLKNVFYKRSMKQYVINDSKTILLIEGGANINDMHSHGIKLFKFLLDNNPKNTVVVAPETYWFSSTHFPRLLQHASQPIYLFCRERNSYSLLSSMALPSNVHIQLSPDTAFYLSINDLTTLIPLPFNRDYTLICLRTDNESNINKPKTAISQKGKIIFGDISTIVPFENFVSLVEGASVVYTDRLHVAILAAILGKKALLFPNSYGKNKGVYDYTLSQFPSVQFVSEPQAILETVGCNVKFSGMSTA